MLSFVGIGTSFGHPLDVPIVLRSLAASMAILEENDLPMGLDRDFLMTLDSDLSFQNPICQIVDEYDCAWWNGRKPRSLDLAKVMDRSSVFDCLEKHENQLIGNIEPIYDISALPKTPILPLNADISANIPGSSTTKPIKCRKCDKYSQILSNSLQDILDTHSFASTMLTCSETQWNIDMRRASTFNLLHEAVVIKEMANPMADKQSALPKGNIIESVTEKAKRELVRLKSLPYTSYKWTWGEKLT